MADNLTTKSQPKYAYLYNYRKLLILIVILVIAGASYHFYFRYLFMHIKGGQGMPVKIAEVVAKEITEWDEFPAKLESINRVEVKSRVAGMINKIHFSDGDMVTKDQLLFTLDQTPFIVAVNKANSVYEAAKSQAEFSEADFNRSEKLISTKAISQRDFDASRNAYIAAKNNLKLAESELEVANLNLEYTEIKAPIAGKIGRAEITAGNLINSGASAIPLTVIVSIDPIYVNFNIDEQNYLKYIEVNTEKSQIPVEVIINSKNVYSGKISSFDNEFSNNSGTIRARAIIENKEATLVPGVFTNVRIGGKGKTNAILIPELTISTDQSKKFVLVAGKDNKALYQEVTLGPVIEGLRVVKTGLKVGDKILLNGLQFIRPGMPIQPILVPMIEQKK